MEQLIKRIIALTIAIITLVSAWAYDFKVDNIYYYKMTDTEIRVTYRYYDSSSNNYAYTGEIIIPEKVTYNGKEYSVTSIGDYAFSWCTGLTSVTIPNSVTSIGNRAFYNCTGLTSVTIPNSVTEIGDNAFYNCTSLRSVVFNATNCTIYGSSNVRPFPSSITSLTIGNNVTTIPDYFLYGFSKIETITIPNSVTKIGSSSFRDCSGLTSVTIPNSVTTIGSYAFKGCI